MLGQIELGQSAPTVRVLVRIAAGLGVELTTLLVSARPRLHVLRAPSRGTAPVLLRIGAGEPGSAVLHQVRLPPGGTLSYPETTRRCRLTAVVVRGTVEVTSEGETLTLGEEDALEVDTVMPLHWRNAAEHTGLVYALVQSTERPSL